MTISVLFTLMGVFMLAEPLRYLRAHPICFQLLTEEKVGGPAGAIYNRPL
jgi:hypothetical protein